jgi:hypothetical protein
MGKHEDKDKAEQQRKIDSNGLIRTGRFRIKIPVASTEAYAELGSAPATTLLTCTDAV